MSDAGAVERGDIEAVGAARAELGPDYEPALLEGFADRVEAAVEHRLAAASLARAPDHGLERRLAAQQFALAVLSLIAAVPISVVSAVQGELLAMVVAWVGIVAVNAAHAWRAHR